MDSDGSFRRFGPGIMEQREKSMGADVSAKVETVTEVARPATYVPETEPPQPRESVGLRTDAKKPSVKSNRLREMRIEKMMSKAELARRANLSVLTIDRVEKGLGCRMDTKRKILEALGLSLADRVRVFGEEE